jgi:hypothetical protein
VAAALKGKAASVTILDLPGLTRKGDVSDWLDAGGDKATLLELAEKAARRAKEEATGKYTREELGDAMNNGGAIESPPLGILLSTVLPQRVEWLWAERVPFGKLTILDGDPGLGKSVLTLDLAARVSRGMPMPCGAPGRLGGVVLLSAEDGLEDTIVPRLEVAGADRSRIVALDLVPDSSFGMRLPSFPRDAEQVKMLVLRLQAALVVVDPLTAYLGENVNSHRDQDCRRALFPLAKLAEETGAAVVVVRHLNKAAGDNPLYRGGGSIGIIGAARSGLLLAKDPENENRRILASTKCNLAKLSPSLAFTFETAANDSLRIVWTGVSELGAQSLLAMPSDNVGRDAVQEAIELLQSILATGPLPAKQVVKEARAAGIAERTLHRAKSELGIKSQKVGLGIGAWKWSLPPQVP